MYIVILFTISQCVIILSVVYRDLFNKFDVDSSNSIDPSELGNALRWIGCNPTKHEIECMIHDAQEIGNIYESKKKLK